jgi:hypothetical protein
MNRYTYQWSNVRDSDPRVRIVHQNMVDAENENDAEGLIVTIIQTWMDDFNKKTSHATQGHMEELHLINMEKLPDPPKKPEG